MAIVIIDANEACAGPLRGWGRYIQRLVGELERSRPGDIRVRAVRRRGRGPEALWEQVGVARSARRHRAAVLHAPNCFLALRRPCAGVVTIHDLAFETHPSDFAARTGAKYRLLAPRAVRSAERVICDSQFTAEDLAARYGADPARLRVIPLAPALPRFGAEAGRPATTRPYLIGVGDLREKKDWPTLVRAWLSLRRAGSPHGLVLVGADAGQGPRLRALAGREPLTLTGYADDRVLDALLCGADALVHPSRHEGFGLVLLEAMSRGIPVLAARAAALPETAGDAALLFAPGDDSDLARQLGGVLEDPRLRGELIARGLRRADQHSWASTARATLDVYRELI